MSKKQLERILLIVIGIEVLAAACVLAWVVFLRNEPAAINNQPRTATTAPTHTPVVEPVLYTQGLSRPTSIASLPDAADKRLFATEAAGKVRAITPDATLASAPLLDITGKVLDNGQEMGLLGLAFDPKFADNGYFYVNYVNKSQETVIARYTVNKQTFSADPASEKVLLKIKQPYANHNGGALAFGPDGYLYIGMGDGGGSGDPENRAQNRQELLGKILRIDVDKGSPYSIPSSNPFAEGKGGRPEIWAMGLRNAWRLSFDSKTGDLYIADVGQDKYEEIDFQKAGAAGGVNYGWRCQEAMHDFNTTANCPGTTVFTPPIFEYTHDENRCSVTGGYVYRGAKYPSLAGKYLYGDYCSGQLYYAQQTNGKWQQTLAASTQFSISTFGQASNGELYLADIKTVSLYHITDTKQ
ncbi:MAG TPA: PQQ-dependent sugar dehydrogenase [Candidatus Saccharimonadales bacterium]|nr:PQQ-dependent sugar dehydrogenase [Candidatus Saccharimonadales bacterium]